MDRATDGIDQFQIIVKNKGDTGGGKFRSEQKASILPEPACVTLFK
jgi:hypothetical protein